MKKIVKQLKLFAVLILALVLMAGMAFVTFAEETGGADATAPDLSGVKWVLEGTDTDVESLTYTGEKFTLTPVNLPAGVELGRVSGNVGVNVNNYTAKAVIEYAVGTETRKTEIEHKWSITKATYDLSGVTFEDGAFVYDGTEHNLEIAGTLPKGVRVNYSAPCVNAGVYSVVAKFLGDAKNYEPIPEMTATMTINKAVYDMSGVSFEDRTLIYRGINQTLSVSGTLPSGVRVSYDASYKDVGEYDITANFIGDANNYEPIEPMVAKMTIIPATAEDCVYTYKDSSGNVIVKVVAADGIPADTLNVLENSYLYNTIEISKYYSIDILSSYDLGFAFNGQTQLVNEKLTVSILIPKALRDRENLEMVYITDDGKVEAIPFERSGDMFVFETNHFSTYAMAVGYSTLTAPIQEIPWWMIVLFVLDALSIAFLVVALCLKPRKIEPEDAPDETDGDAPSGDDTPEKTEEKVADLEETAVESEVESQDEEQPEAPVEKVAEEEKSDDASAPLSSDSDDEDSASAVVGGQVVMVRYRSSFMSRLIQADADIQDYYNVIKNTLLMYKGVKARTSWNFESFNRGRLQCAKLNIKGRTLTIYLALAPDEYNASKYHFSDVSGKGKFDKVPMMLKVRSDRALKYAIELIEELMKAHDIEAGPAQNVDYRMPYETTEALVERDLVKIILPDGVTVGENDSLVKVDVSDVIDGANSEE